jgi:hypothetical protein
MVTLPARGGAQRAEIGAAGGLAEQHAPDFLGGEGGGQEALPLGRRPVGQQALGAVVDGDGIDQVGRRDAGPLHFLVDDQLQLRGRREPPGPGPVRGGVAGLGQLAARGPGPRLEPGAHIKASGVILSGQLEIHGFLRGVDARSVRTLSNAQTPEVSTIKLTHVRFFRPVSPGWAIRVDFNHKDTKVTTGSVSGPKGWEKIR